MSRPWSAIYIRRSSYDFMWAVVHWMKEHRYSMGAIYPSRVVRHFECTWLEAALVPSLAATHGHITRRADGRYFTAGLFRANP
jgi:hypothetical protein